MRERKFVKFRVDMYDDTKFKIIDMKPERNLIHYVWTRVVVLAGKINLEGELFLSKTIPYTIETLAIEFNREVNSVKAAFDVLIELEMIELTEDNIYKVRNFAKHQNIKVKETNKLSVKEENIKNKESEEIKKEKPNSNDKEPDVKIIQNEKDNLKANEGENKKSENISDLMANNKDISVTDGYNIDNKVNNGLENSVPISLEAKRNNKVNNKKKDNSSDIREENEEDNADVCGFTEEKYVLNPGERVLKQWSF